MSPTTARWVASVISVVALLALVRESGHAREAILREADLRAASHAAGYLTLIAPPRANSSYSDLRLLSAANALAGADYWSGHLQVWLEGAPLLPIDTIGASRDAVPLPGSGAVPRGAVAAWQTVPETSKVPAQVAPWIGIVAIAIATGTGALVAPGRRRRIMLGVVLTVVLLAAVDLSWRVAATDRAAVEIGLLRSRRMLEVTAVTAKLSDAAIMSVTSGWTVTRVKGNDIYRERVVTWDTLGASVAVVAARNQAWRLAAPSERAQLPPVWLRIILLGWLTLLGAVVAGALPPGEGYLMTSPRTPPISS